MGKASYGFFKGWNDLRIALIKRFETKKMTPSMVVTDAKKSHIKIDLPRLSRYINGNGNGNGGLSEEIIIWLCIRHGIEFKMKVIMKPQYTIDRYDINKKMERYYGKGYRIQQREVKSNGTSGTT